MKQKHVFRNGILLFSAVVFGGHSYSYAGDGVRCASSSSKPLKESVRTMPDEPRSSDPAIVYNPYGASFRPGALFETSIETSTTGRGFTYYYFIPELGSRLLEGSQFHSLRPQNVVDTLLRMIRLAPSVENRKRYDSSQLVPDYVPGDSRIHGLIFGSLRPDPPLSYANKLGHSLYASPITNDRILIAKKFDRVVIENPTTNESFTLGDLIREGKLDYKTVEGTKTVSIEEIKIVRESLTGIQAYSLQVTEGNSSIKFLLPPSLDRTPMSELFFRFFIPSRPGVDNSGREKLLTDDMADYAPYWSHSTSHLTLDRSFIGALSDSPFNRSSLIPFPGLPVGEFRNVKSYIEFDRIGYRAARAGQYKIRYPWFRTHLDYGALTRKQVETFWSEMIRQADEYSLPQSTKPELEKP